MYIWRKQCSASKTLERHTTLPVSPVEDRSVVVCVSLAAYVLVDIYFQLAHPLALLYLCRKCAEREMKRQQIRLAVDKPQARIRVHRIA